MTEYTLDVNGKRFELNDEFRNAIEQRAKKEYEENGRFSCWWTTADPDNYEDEEWKQNIHEEGDPVLVIETDGIMVPWDKLDQLEAQIPEVKRTSSGDDETEELASGSGMKSLPPREPPTTSKEIFGRTHFTLTPHRFEEVPEPGGNDPDKIPPKPIEMGNDPEMIIWLPRHPDIDHTWGAGEAVAPMSSWVEWNVQQRANQPRPNKGKHNSHDSFESLCRAYDCTQVAEYTASDGIPEETPGQVERKGEEAYENGRFGGGNWNA